ncbi:transcription elongation factor B polypeptide 3 isoform X2 [Neocloeon triangulifer]|nr:transcription elongation factor B polypeptide 3 isoform X2 [Neocloeon triangulifer]
MEIVESNMTEDEEAQDQSGDEGHAKENGRPDRLLEKSVLSPENGTKKHNGLDCSDKNKSTRSHQSSSHRSSVKEEFHKEEKSKHRHGSSVDDRKRTSSSDHRLDASKSKHKSSREDKDRDRYSSNSKRPREDKSPKKIKREPVDDELDNLNMKKLKISSLSEPPRIKEERLSPSLNAASKYEKRSSVKVKKEIKKEKESSSFSSSFDMDVVIPKMKQEDAKKVKVKSERLSPPPGSSKDKAKPSTSKLHAHVNVKKEVKKEKHSDNSTDEDGGANAGFSFEDALGNLDYTPTKKSKEKKKKSVPKTSSVYKPLPRSDELASLLDQPALTYRPLPHVPLKSSKPIISEADDFSDVLKNKNQRTKVYSGMKAFHGEVPTLQDLCIKILQDNVDAFEHVGSVPFFLLEPVFSRANASQLARIEHYNPQFVEDLDALWESLVSNEFKTAIRQEYECWRDVYERSLSEREDKMSQLAAKIKANNEARKAPQRTTKLAFEHSLVKPPRSVRKQQEKHGTARGSLPSKVSQSYDSNEAGPSGMSSKESTLARTVGLLRDGPSTAIKGKKRPAPLMQKTLKFMKTNFRR